MMARARSTRSLIPATPEGPYEILGDGQLDRKSSLEILQMVDFVARASEMARSLLPRDSDLRELGIVLELVRNHFEGRLTTISSLADASGLSYGTAIRAINKLGDQGFIARRTRTASGKSFSLHPSAELLRRWQIYGASLRSLAELLVAREPASARAVAHQAGKADAEASSILPPPPVLGRKLALPRGLRVLVHADPTFMAMNALKRQFELILGVDIHSRALSIDRLREEIVHNSRARSSSYDLVACDLPWFGDMACTGRLHPLDELIAESSLDLSDFIPDAVASARWRGTQFGIPVLTTAEMLVGRQDLLAEVGLSLPRTLEALLDAARLLNSPEKGVYGLAWNGGRGTALGHTFITLMAAHGQPILELPRGPDGFDAEAAGIEMPRPMFLSDAARLTAQFLLAVLPLSPPEILSMAWYDRARAYASGRAALAYSHTLLANLFERNPKSPAYRRTLYAPHPTGPAGRPISVLGGYALAIPSNLGGDRVAPVWEALRMLTSDSAAKLYILHGSLASPRFSVNRDPEIAAISPLIGVVDDMARQRVLRMWPRPPVPGISAVIQIAGEEIHDMLLGLKSPERALLDAQHRAERLAAQRAAF